MLKDIRQRSKANTDLRIDKAQEQLRSDHIKLLHSLAATTKERDSLRAKVDKFEKYVDIKLVDRLEELSTERLYLMEQVEELTAAADTAAATAPAEDADEVAVLRARASQVEDLTAAVERLGREKTYLESSKKTMEFKHKGVAAKVNGLEASLLMTACDVQSHELRWQRACRTRAIFDAGRESDRQRVEYMEDQCLLLERHKARLVVRVQDLEMEVAEQASAAMEGMYAETDGAAVAHGVSVKVQTEDVVAPCGVAIALQTPSEWDEAAEPDQPSTAFVTAAPAAALPPPANTSESKMKADDFHAFIKLKEENRRLRIQLADTTARPKS
jgi:hypothetical protein